MYLACLIADEKKITKEQIENWAEKSTWYMLSEYAVAWIAAESPHGLELARQWIGSESEKIASSGWATFSGIISLKELEELDLGEIEKLLEYIGNKIHSAQNRVRYAMNNFVISVGGYIPELTDKALQTGNKVGKVSVDMGGTSCKVPFAPDYIEKMIGKGIGAKKRKSLRQ